MMEMLLITPAYAQTAAGAAVGLNDIFIQYVAPFGLIFIIMYFLVLRPQTKKAKDHAELIKNVRRGDNIVTSGGLIGKVTKVIDDAEVEIEIAPNVRVRVARPMIADVRSKAEPVKEQA
jgi:preprotein translocase subunit YajC